MIQSLPFQINCLRLSAPGLPSSEAEQSSCGRAEAVSQNQPHPDAKTCLDVKTEPVSPEIFVSGSRLPDDKSLGVKQEPNDDEWLIVGRNLESGSAMFGEDLVGKIEDEFESTSQKPVDNEDIRNEESKADLPTFTGDESNELHRKMQLECPECQMSFRNEYNQRRHRAAKHYHGVILKLHERALEQRGGATDHDPKECGICGKRGSNARAAVRADAASPAASASGAPERWDFSMQRTHVRRRCSPRTRRRTLRMDTRRQRKTPSAANPWETRLCCQA